MLRRLTLASCTLDAGERAERVQRLEALAARATSRTADELRFPPDAQLAAELAAAAALETLCCNVSFRLELDRDGMTLVVDAP